MNRIPTKLSHPSLFLALALALLPAAAYPQSTPATDMAARIKRDCKVDDTETNPAKLNKASACVEQALKAIKRQAAMTGMLNSAAGVTTVSQGQTQSGQRQPGPMALALSTGNVGAWATGNAGASAIGTSNTCGAGSGDNNPLIRVHRVLLAPRNASDDFGYRLGRRYIIYQVTISNDNKDFQYLIHDVSVDLSAIYNAPAQTYVYRASSQELSLLRGIPEKGQDLDPRNLTLHILQGIGGVAGAVSGLTPFSDVMGSTMGIFNGSFLQGYIGIAPDHTGTQLNRLSDLAYTANEIVDKQRARTIAIFVPEATLLNPSDQKLFWKNPYEFLQVYNFDRADICVDGAFITTVAAPTLTSAMLTPKPLTGTIGPNNPVTLTIAGTNLSTSDTQVVGLGDPVLLTTASGTTGSVDIVLPPGYTAGMPVHLASAANPTMVSATIPTTVFAAPTLTAATLKPKAPSTTLAGSSTVTISVTGTNLSTADTQVAGVGAPALLTAVAADGKSGSVDIVLPSNYASTMQIYLVSKTNSGVQSAAVTPTAAQ